MVKKSSTPRRAAPKPGGARASNQSNKQVSEKAPLERAPEIRRKRPTLQERIMEHLAEIPALLAVSTLSEMLRDTAHRPTRLAIQKARIDVLRARVIACRLGKPADGSITLAALLNRNANIDVAPVETPPVPTEEAQTAPTPAPMPPEEAQQDMRIELTEEHIHQGFQLRKGTKLVVNAAIGAGLIEMDVAKPVAYTESEEDAAEPAENAPDEVKTEDLDDQDTAVS